MFLLFYRSYISSATRRLPPSQYWNFVFIRLGSWSLVNSYKQKTKTEPPIPESFWNIYTGGMHARFGVQMYLGYILVHTKSYQDWWRIGCAGHISILLRILIWCSISLLWKNDIFWHLDWFFEIVGIELPIFLHGWLEGLQGFHLERVWLHKNFYFLVKKCLDFWGKNLKKLKPIFL